MLTDRFHRIRRRELDDLFTKENISKIWRKVVRDQLRRVDIVDLFDNYDFNYYISEQALLIRRNLLNGNYFCSPPLIYRIEKKLGICRHLVIPRPTDALILQIITESISKEVFGHQPSSNSFYSQDKHNIRKPHEIDEYGFNWRELWKKMQKKIYNFKDQKELVIVTDLSNYYDSIYISELRKIISSYVNGKEVLLDILFRILERVTWQPDYLPYTGKGLPTSNLEGIRLLAHSFLYELDEILKDKSNDSFTRWMDDIVIGANSRDEAIETLSSASDILKSRGLALNLKKTDIYNAEQAEFHFLIEENKYLDSINIEFHKSRGISKIGNELLIRFKSHLKNNKGAKYKEKITKRYITIFGKLNSSRLLSQIPELFNENPGIRQNLLFYLSALGYSKRTSAIVIKVIDNLRIYDDISLFNICRLITDWEIPNTEKGLEFVNLFSKKVSEIGQKRRTSFDFYCALWVKAKYDHPDELYHFINKYQNIWKSTPFLRRQATIVMARLLLYKEDRILEFLNNQISTSESQVVSIANSIIQFSNFTSIEGKVKMYLFPESKPKSYPLHKFLVLCSFLNSRFWRTNEEIKKEIKDYITDPIYRKWLDFQYNIN